MKTKFTQVFSLLLVCCIFCSMALMPANAAEVEEATIDMERLCQLNLYKYDFTNAAKDGVWTTESYVSTGQYDQNVNNILGNALRKGDSNNSSDLDANGTSTGYAIKGVEFTYLRVAEILTFTESANDQHPDYNLTQVLYAFDKDAAADLLTTIGLPDGAGRYENADVLNYETSDPLDPADPESGVDTQAITMVRNCWYYQSDVLIKALSDALEANATTVKTALESFITANGGTAMPLTDANGYTHADQLPVGLYLLVETKVPEMVTSTTNPFFISLPMTDVNGGGNGEGANTTQYGNGGQNWMYNVTVYPKNETGIVTLEKTVREAVKDTGKNDGSNSITDGFDHNATGSTSDLMEYQIISTLPTITSSATNISTYTFKDVLSRGLTYDASTPVKIEFFKNATCLAEDLVATWLPTDEVKKFTVSRVENKDGSHTMTIAMTEAGLAEINGDTENAHGKLYAGYSNYTLRISYAAKMNPDESLVYGDAGNPNEVVLTWSRTSSEYYDTLVDDCHVYSYGINLTKVFSDKKDDQELFDDVLFNIQNKTDGYYVQAKLNEEEGVWYVIGHTSDKSAATAFYPVTWNDKKGQIVVKGLEDDTYILTELQTADGYTLLKEAITVEITAKVDTNRSCSIYSKDILGVIQNDSRYNFDGGLDLRLANIPQTALAHCYLSASATVDGNAVTMLADDVDVSSSNAMAPLTVVNTQGFDLPQTGQTGAKWMPIIGGSLVGIAALCFFVVILCSKKEKENGNV